MINAIFFACGAAVIAVAIYALVLPGMTTGAMGVILWVMLGTGILTVLLSLWGCCIASSQSKSGLCCYGFILIIALVISVLYVIAGGVASSMITGATECGFNPESSYNANGTDCRSLEGVMNMSAAAYMATGSSCNATFVSDPEPQIICQSGDMWIQNIANAECPTANNDLDNQAACKHLLIGSVPDQADTGEADLAASYFCECPARFTTVYTAILTDSMIPGIVQACVLFLLVFASCCLMCMPKQRQMVMQRYYVAQSQSPAQAPVQASQGRPEDQAPDRVNVEKAGHTYV